MPGPLFGAGGGGNLRRRLVVSDSVSASVGTVGRQGATGGWCVGRGGRSGRGRGGAGARPAGGASGSWAADGGGAMGSVPSREGARRYGKRGGAAKVAGFAGGASGGVEPEDTGALDTSPVTAPAPGVPAAVVSPVPSVTGGSAGDGGVAGRGGMEARRASVLMHPPFPRTGAQPAESVRRGTRPSRARIPARAGTHPRAYLRARRLLAA
ncbi:hypothetical protein [Streptomyces sp. NBC_01538]|uniref:hypothetical protein n=1 Tax=Streptomyces sp. NBC_01538 TaxID=2903897 RepID=UPI0038686AB6